MTDVDAISIEQRIAVLSTGVVVPIVSFFGADGEEVDDPKSALTFVCGSGSNWYVGRIADFSPKCIN